MIKKLILFTACAGLVACSQGAKDKTAYDVSLPMKEVMGHMVDPAAWAFWNRSGEIVDMSGTRSRVPVDPKTIPEVPGYADDEQRAVLEKEWVDAESGTIQLIQASNILRLPGYVRKVDKNDNGDWTKFAEQLNQYAHDAQEATEAKDGQKMFDTGGQLFQVCTSCHDKYLIPFVDPKTGEMPTGLTAAGEPVQKK